MFCVCYLMFNVKSDFLSKTWESLEKHEKTLLIKNYFSYQKPGFWSWLYGFLEIKTLHVSYILKNALQTLKTEQFQNSILIMSSSYSKSPVWKLRCEKLRRIQLYHCDVIKMAPVHFNLLSVYNNVTCCLY